MSERALLHAAFELVHGTGALGVFETGHWPPGRIIDKLRRAVPGREDEEYLRAHERVREMFAVALKLERDHQAVSRLAAMCPGFVDEEYQRALRHARTQNAF